MSRDVVLVNDRDDKVGTVDIWNAHRDMGKQHRAISVLLLRKNGKDVEALLQKRSSKKPLWPLYWSNTCCTHPFDGEGYLECAVRRLREEMGIIVNESEIRELYRFQYQARYNEELAENELDTVITGWFRGGVEPNPDEAADYKWVELEELRRNLEMSPAEFTPWFKKIIEDRRLANFLIGE